MKNSLFIIFLGISLNAIAAEKDSFKVGLGFQGHRSQYGADLDLVTPNLISIVDTENRSRNGLAIIFTGGWDIYENIIQTSSLYLDRFIPKFSLGLRGTRYQPDSTATYYTAMAADLAIVGSDLSSRSTSWGLRVTFGCDILLARDVSTFLGKSDTQFFVQGDLVFLHNRMDKLSGEPRLLSGFTPKVGVRSSF